MRILVDADSSGKIDTIKRIAKQNELEVHLFYDSSHQFDDNECIHHQVAQDTDNADFAILNFCMKYDIVITRDGGLAAMAMSKGAYVINTIGMEYTDSNILSILTSRHLNKKERMRGNKIRSINGKGNIHYNFERTLKEIISRKERLINESKINNDV